MTVAAMKQFRGKYSIMTCLAIFFYFPYTILLDLIIVVAVIKYGIQKKRYFIS